MAKNYDTICKNMSKQTRSHIRSLAWFSSDSDLKITRPHLTNFLITSWQKMGGSEINLLFPKRKVDGK